MISFEKRLVASAFVGAGVAAGIFGAYEASEGFDPAAARLEQVENCEPHLQREAQVAQTTVPAECEVFKEDFRTEYELYSVPSQQDFLKRFTPGSNYNTQRRTVEGVIGTIGGFVIAGLTYYGPEIYDIVSSPPGQSKSNNPKAPVAPGVPTPMSIEEYRRRYAKKANKQPLDDLPSPELNRYFAQFMQNQQRPPAN